MTLPVPWHLHSPTTEGRVLAAASTIPAATVSAATVIETLFINPSLTLVWLRPVPGLDMAFGNPEFPMTRGRSTYVTLDDDSLKTLQQGWLWSRNMHEISLGGPAKNVHYIDGIGWRLKAHQSEPDTIYQRDYGDTVYAESRGTLMVADKHTEFEHWRQPSVLGLSGNYAATVPTSGSIANQKQPEAPDSEDQRLAAYETSSPGPELTDDPAPVDCVAVTPFVADPRDGDITRFYVPGGSLQSYGTILVKRFAGPAGSGGGFTGYGQYAVKLKGSGRARLFELGMAAGGSSPTWKLRREFEWCPPQMVHGMSHQMWIATDCVLYSDDRLRGSRIVIKTTFMGVLQKQASSSANLITLLAQVAMQAIKNTMPAFVYKVKSEYDTPIVPAPSRLDVARDIHVIWQLAKFSYPESGTLQTDIFSLSCLPSGSTPAVYYFWGDIPDLTNLTVSIRNAKTGAVVPSTLLTLGPNGGSVSFVPVERQKQYYAVYTFQSDGARRRTPTLVGEQGEREAVTTLIGPTPIDFPYREAGVSLWRRVLTDCSVVGPSEDPTHESAVIGIYDACDDLSRLRVRGEMPLRVTVKLPGNKQSVIFKGFVERALAKQRRGKPGAALYPSQTAHHYSVHCAGEWKRLTELRCPTRFSFFDNEAKKPYRASDAIKALFALAGIKVIDCPESEIRLYPSEDQKANESAQIVEPMTPLADEIRRIAWEYLYSQVVFDPNAKIGTTEGIWRILPRKAAPYTKLARFVISHPGDKKLPQDLDAYGTVNIGGHDVPRVPVFGPPETWVEAPETNHIRLYGTAPEKPKGGGGTTNYTDKPNPEVAVIIGEAHNFDSYNPLGLDPGDPGYPDYDSPDYVGREKYTEIHDPKIVGEENINWVLRRMIDVAGHARYHATFRAPLVFVTDPDDTLQFQPRPPRFYDIVELEQPDGTVLEYILLSCNPQYAKDHRQLAYYELVRPVNMVDYAGI